MKLFLQMIRTAVIMLFSVCMVSCSQEKVRIAWIGKGFVDGSRSTGGETNAYAAQLGATLGIDYEVIHFSGNVGETAEFAAGAYPEREEFKQVLGFRPDWVLIEVGTHDVVANDQKHIEGFVDDLNEVVIALKELPRRPRVVLLLPNPTFSGGGSSNTPDEIIRRKVIEQARRVAFEHDCEIVGLYDSDTAPGGSGSEDMYPPAERVGLADSRLYELIKMGTDTSFDIVRGMPEQKKLSEFHGYKCYSFEFLGRQAKVVVPKIVADGRPWVWRARFWGHEPQTDVALLERGFHVVYCDVAELYGNEEAVSIWNNYYEMLTRAGLAQKAAMEGMSRGGMYVYRWLSAYPGRVAVVYADAPVLDMKSWPGGKGRSDGSNMDWEKFKEDFGLQTESDAIAFRGNPIDMADSIAATGIPLLHVVGEDDSVVPVDENTDLFAQRIIDAGGAIDVIRKPGIGHHPHSLYNPRPIVDFILTATNQRTTIETPK